MKRSGTPEHMLSEAGAGVELRPLGRGGVVPAVSSPGRQSLQSQYTPAQQYSSQHAAAVSGPHPVYSTSRSYAPSTTYNPGYQQQEGGGGGPPASRRYQSEGQLLGEAGQQAAVGSSTSAGQLQVGLISHWETRRLNTLLFIPGAGGVATEIILHVEAAPS